jgi:hypothetical protein
LPLLRQPFLVCEPAYSNNTWLGRKCNKVTNNASSVTYDTGYDIASRSLNDVACSDGANGLIPRFGWTTQGEVAGFPAIGGAFAVGGWNSTSCGTCWKLEWEGNTINVLAIDHAAEGFNLALRAMNVLTNNQAEMLGTVEAEATQVELADCGITE